MVYATMSNARQLCIITKLYYAKRHLYIEPFLEKHRERQLHFLQEEVLEFLIFN